jgi:hypothetical protein
MEQSPWEANSHTCPGHVTGYKKRYADTGQLLLLLSSSSSSSPWSRVLTKLVVAQVVKKLLYTGSHHCSLSSVRRMHSTVSVPIFFKIHFTVTLPSTPRSRMLSPPFRFPYYNFLRISDLLHARYMTRPSHDVPAILNVDTYVPQNIVIARISIPIGSLWDCSIFTGPLSSYVQ